PPTRARRPPQLVLTVLTVLTQRTRRYSTWVVSTVRTLRAPSGNLPPRLADQQPTPSSPTPPASPPSWSRLNRPPWSLWTRRQRGSALAGTGYGSSSLASARGPFSSSTCSPWGAKPWPHSGRC